MDHVVCVDAGFRLILYCVEKFSMHFTIQIIRSCVAARVELIGGAKVSILESELQRAEGKIMNSKTTAQNQRRCHRRHVRVYGEAAP